MKKVAIILTLILALFVTSLTPASAANPQFDAPIQVMEPSELRHVGNFDSDRLTDLLLVSKNILTYRKGNGRGGFETSIQSTLNTEIFNITWTSTGDVTGDGIEDFVFIVPFGKDLQIYQGSPSGAFSFYKSIEFGYGVNKPIIGDFNSDSYSDILITGTGTWGGNYFLEGTSRGISSQKIEYKDGFYSSGMRCDVSRLAKISPTGGPALLCIESSSIGIVPMSSATMPSQINSYSSPYTSGSFLEDKHYAIADLSGDGLLDLVAARGNLSQMNLLVYENSRLGLNSPKSVSSPAISWNDSIFATDIDGDSKPDLIIFKPSGLTYYSINLGGLNFKSFEQAQINLTNISLIVTDLNGDSIGDFIFSGNNRISVSLTRNVFKIEAEAKAKAKQEADAKAAAELKAKQDADAKAAAELKAKQDADAKAAADKIIQDAKLEAARILSEAKAAATKKKTITCTKGKLTKKVTSIKPKCPKGYKVKK